MIHRCNYEDLAASLYCELNVTVVGDFMVMPVHSSRLIPGVVILLDLFPMRSLPGTSV